MSSLTNFLAGLGAWNWFILAVVLLALETVLPGVHLLWFGLAAAATGGLVVALGLASPTIADGFGWPLQVIAFAGLAVATVFAVRRLADPAEAGSDLPDLNARAAQYVGRTFIVAEPIADGRGKIKVGDTIWMAEGPDTPAGVHVRVTGTRGTVLVVERRDAT